MVIELDDDEKRLRKHIEGQINKRIQNIVLVDSPYVLRLEITDNEYYAFDFNCERVKMVFNLSYYNLLKNLINNRKKELINLANLYWKNGRDFQTFLYDLIVLIYFVNKLPTVFQKLLQQGELQSEGDLMHNRILAQIAYTFKKNHKVILITKCKECPTSDLKIDNFLVDVKVLTGRVSWTTKDVQKLILKIKDKYKKGMVQTENGIVFMAFWSKNMNNLFRDYFVKQFQTSPYELENNNCYFVLDGFDALDDFYTSKYVFQLKENLPTCNLIRNFNPLTSPSHFGMFQVLRNHFPIVKGGPLRDMGMSFSMG